MKTVKDQADIGMVCPADHFPGIPVIVDVTAPGERLVADADAMLCGAFAQFLEIGGGPVDAAQRDWRDI